MLAFIVVLGLMALIFGGVMSFFLSFKINPKLTSLSALIGITGLIMFTGGLYLVFTPIPLEGIVINKFQDRALYYVVMQTENGLQQKRISVDLFYNTEIDDEIIVMVDR